MAFDSPDQIREQIESWIKEEKMPYRLHPDPNAYFNFEIIAVPQEDIKVNVAMTNHNGTGIVVSSGLGAHPDLLKLVRRHSKREQEEFVYNLKMSLLNFRIRFFFAALDPSKNFQLENLKSIRFEGLIWFSDGLTKGKVFDKMEHVLQAFLLARDMIRKWVNQPVSTGSQGGVNTASSETLGWRD